MCAIAGSHIRYTLKLHSGTGALARRWAGAVGRAGAGAVDRGRAVGRGKAVGRGMPGQGGELE